ncbi:MAG: hypothetical protein ACFFAN_12335 [Promethearchaeota archaeon]
MSKGNNKKQQIVTCCVMNCQAEIPIEKAMKIDNKYFCSICGVAYYRSKLNL